MTLQTRDMELMLGQRGTRICWTTIDPAFNLAFNVAYIVIAWIHSLDTSHKKYPCFSAGVAL